MSDATIGWGSTFELHNGTALTALAEVTEITIPEAVIDTVEVTHLTSANRYKEFIKGLIDAGEFTVTMNYAPGSATDILCRGALTAATGRAFNITLSDAAGAAEWEIAGTALVTGYTRNPIVAGEAKTASLTMKVSGALTEAAA